MGKTNTDKRLDAIREKLLESLETAVAQIPDSPGSDTVLTVNHEEKSIVRSFNLADMAKTWAILTECGDTGF